MATEKLPEVWLRGPVDNIPSLLQPVAHALLQAKTEVNQLMNDFPDELLWLKPGGAASVGFHLQHLTGVLDRLFTYANAASLSEAQLSALARESHPQQNITGKALVNAFNLQVDLAIKQLGTIDEQTLPDYRSVGRAQLPSTVMGLLFHAAEHTMRHLGQLLVTVKVLTSTSPR